MANSVSHLTSCLAAKFLSEWKRTWELLCGIDPENLLLAKIRGFLSFHASAFLRGRADKPDIAIGVLHVAHTPAAARVITLGDLSFRSGAGVHGQAKEASTSSISRQITPPITANLTVANESSMISDTTIAAEPILSSAERSGIS
ncbi:unnamed protein product [Fraxinus pennsylvanica]|uniref:Uncharacterized protein n=1 Tax=Fraxinus pennsylvanica TaxID=56036 RepID=A0AAD1Z5K2_9LAMI|nr:unnamed protein product [Fraxinus pennsylvanica]